MSYKWLPNLPFIHLFEVYPLIVIFLDANVLEVGVNEHVLLFDQLPFHSDKLFHRVFYELFRAFGKPNEQ